jgi:ABC-type transport system involved in multi-copper enzyme maturation permease subunit
MKYFAILKDSLRETIDSKVFFVVAVIAVLAIGGMATLSLEANSSEEGLQKITDRFADGSQEMDVPVFGRVKVTPAFTQYTVQDVKAPENNDRPWEGEYQFVIEARDLVPLGSRIAMLQYSFAVEEEKERVAKTGRKTRGRQIREEIIEEVRRIQEREQKKGRDRMTTQQAIMDQLMAFISQRLEREVRSLPMREMEQFIEEQTASHGNWEVLQVQSQELPPEQRTIKIKTKVPVQEGEDIRITTEEAEGEVNRFLVTVKPRGSTYRAWPHKATLLFGGVSLGNASLPGELVTKINHYVVGLLGAPAIMLLGCVITAFFIPNMLRKGTIDLLLAKPINRVSLLVYKYVGGLTFMLINTTVLIVGLWVALGLRTGVWEPVFLLAIPILTFEFAMFYALSTFLAVLTRSPIVSILACVILWAVLWGLGWAYWVTAVSSESGESATRGWLATTVETAHTVLPHYLDLDWLADKSLKERTLPDAERLKIDREYGMFRWSESLAVTGLYIVLLLGVACWRFAVRDY